jgi:hypothetical protein
LSAAPNGLSSAANGSRFERSIFGNPIRTMTNTGARRTRLMIREARPVLLIPRTFIHVHPQITARQMPQSIQRFEPSRSSVVRYPARSGG